MNTPSFSLSLTACRIISPIKCGTVLRNMAWRRLRRPHRADSYTQTILAGRAARERLPPSQHRSQSVHTTRNAPRGQFAHKYYKTQREARAFMLLYLLSAAVRFRAAACMCVRVCVSVCMRWACPPIDGTRRKSESNRPQILNLARCAPPIYICRLFAVQREGLPAAIAGMQFTCVCVCVTVFMLRSAA